MNAMKELSPQEKREKEFIPVDDYWHKQGKDDAWLKGLRFIKVDDGLTHEKDGALPVPQGMQLRWIHWEDLDDRFPFEDYRDCEPHHTSDKFIFYNSEDSANVFDRLIPELRHVSESRRLLTQEVLDFMGYDLLDDKGHYDDEGDWVEEDED